MNIKLLFLILLLNYSNCLNILQFAPGLSRSHLMFNYRLASYLTSQGHNVTVWTSAVPLNVGMEFLEQKPPHGVHEIRFISNVDKESQASMDLFTKKLIFKQPSLATQLAFQKTIRKNWGLAFEQMQFDENLFEPIRNVKFDLALAHGFDFSPLAISHKLNIKNLIWHSAGTYILEYSAVTMGIPINPSYIPHMMSQFSDYMSFMQRLRNTGFVSLIMAVSFLPINLFHDEDVIFTSQPDHLNPSLWTVAKQIPSILINGEPSLDFPRPIYSGVVYLGDLSGQDKKANELDVKWKAIIEKSEKGTVIFSLGSVVNTTIMPLEMKAAFLNAFAHFPEYSIIWKFDGDVPSLAPNQSHVHFSHWLPQSQIMNDQRTKLLIAHGGYNSLIEATKAAVPLILIPLFADQSCNAMRAQRHGLGITLNKMEITEEAVVQAMQTILDKPSYKKNALKFADILNDKLVDPLTVFNSHLNSFAKQKWHRELRPGKYMNFFTYYCLDVILFLSCVIGGCIFVIVRIVVAVGKSWIVMKRV